MDTNLQKKSTQALQSGSTNLPAVTFTDTEKTVLALAEPDFENPKVGEYSANSLSVLATGIAKRANARYGNNPQGIEDTISFLVEDLKKFKNLRKKEIYSIVDRGINGEFDKEDVRHFSSSRFVKWVTTYLETLKQPASSKKAQFDHQQLQSLTPSEQEEKTALETLFGTHIQNLELRGELPALLQGLDEVFARCEELKVFDPLSIEEKNIIFNACAGYTGYTGDQLKKFARKAAYLYVLYQAAMKPYTTVIIMNYISKHDKSAVNRFMDLAHVRLQEYVNGSSVIETTYEEVMVAGGKKELAQYKAQLTESTNA